MNNPDAECTPIEIRLTIDTPDPLSGTARAERGETLPFTGWLGLLGVLAQLVGHDGDSDTATRPDVLG